ncbi:unnamed protein product [Symbiodinium microadriaticum]|nr:unnamed protein product [Symbiodinium microadriaticum]
MGRNGKAARFEKPVSKGQDPGHKAGQGAGQDQMPLRPNPGLQELGFAANFLIWSFRTCATGHGFCPPIEGAYSRAFAHDAALALTGVRNLTQILDNHGNRKINMGQPGRLSASWDECSLVAALAAGQIFDRAKVQAHLNWLLAKPADKFMVELIIGLAGDISMADITTEEALRAKMGDAHDLTKQKIYTGLFEEARAFIERSPLLFLGTTSKDGMPTVSPKGDGPGFVKIVDDQTLLIPERPGNRLLHGMSNIIETGTIGLIFVIPGMEETLRITGRCVIKDDEDLCQQLTGHGDRPALLVMQVSIESCFFHCAKAFKRSKTWDASSWGEPMRLSFGDIITRNRPADGLVDKAKQAVTKKAIDAGVKADYKVNL